MASSSHNQREEMSVPTPIPSIPVMSNTALVNQPGVHRFIQFNEPEYQTKSRRFRTCRVDAIKGINWDQLKMIGMHDQLAALLPPNSPWRRFFDILKPSYDELVREFWTTFEYVLYSEANDPYVSFRLCETKFKLSLPEFAVKLGIYEEEELNMPIYTQTIRALPYPVKYYWNKISDTEWCKINKDAKSFKDPLYRYVHRLLTETIKGRWRNPTRVNSEDLIQLYSIFNSVNYNIAEALARYFDNNRTNNPTGIMGGSYITHLAESLGVLNNEIISGLSPPKLPGRVNISCISNTAKPPRIPHFNLGFVTPEILQPQQQMQVFPQSSFYQHDLLSQPQESPLLPESLRLQSQEIPSPTFSSYTNILLNDSELQDIFNPCETSLQQSQQETLLQTTLLPLSQWMQQPPSTGAGPSRVTPEIPPQPTEGDTLENVASQVKWLVEHNRWIEKVLKLLANRFVVEIPNPPSYPYQPF